jgi:hypothetical protein
MYYWLDLIRVDNLGEIGVCKKRSLEFVASLEHSFEISVGSEQLVQWGEGSLSPNDESPELATWSKLEEVQSIHIHHFHSGDV